MGDESLEQNSEYQVLARKYRPSTFSDLIGQDVMVKILENSFLSERISHAFMLTGVRGVGKTTTARIIAKGLNCVGPDGSGTPTTSPCRECQNCLSIAKGNHVDVMEFDAASRTGVSDIREIIDSINYRAASAKYKIYVIDEVHMLSTSAFNALLKTLEEPPPHVKFIFATTEINKVPATVLSRCQRFDLKRIDPENMIEYLKHICSKEGFTLNRDCLGQIARASEGSMRDALSLLEQVFVDVDGDATIDKVRLILGLSDRGRLIDLFECLLNGSIEDALHQYNKLYNEGADPINVLRELCEITHWITLFKVSPKLVHDVTISPDERTRGKALSQMLGVRELARLWQLLIKILKECSVDLNPKIAVEMGLVRVAYSSNIPTPDELIKKIDGKKDKQINPNFNQEGATSIKPELSETSTDLPLNSYFTQKVSGETSSLKMQAIEDNRKTIQKPLSNFTGLLELIRVSRDMELLIEVENNMRLVNYQFGRIEFEPTEKASIKLASRLTAFLKTHTNQRWIVSVVSSGGGKTVNEDNLAKKRILEREAADNDVVSAVFAKFPDSKFYNFESAIDHDKRLSTKSRISSKSGTWEPFEKE